MTKRLDPHPNLLDRLVGSWATEATHPAMPGVVVRGTAVFERLEGDAFLIQRARTDHPDLPDSVSIIGHMGRDRVGDAEGGDAEGGGASAGAEEAGLRMHYFDSRGVSRVYDVSVDEAAWRWSRNAPGFSQRFTGRFSDDGNTIVGSSQLRRDDIHWEDDLQITYRRQT